MIQGYDAALCPPIPHLQVPVVTSPGNQKPELVAREASPKGRVADHDWTIDAQAALFTKLGTADRRWVVLAGADHAALIENSAPAFIAASWRSFHGRTTETFRPREEREKSNVMSGSERSCVAAGRSTVNVPLA
jgi:hypothetical protein